MAWRNDTGLQEKIAGKTSGAKRPPDRDRMLRAEVVAQQTHAAQVTFLGVYAIALYLDKNTHGTEVNALVVDTAVAGSVTEIRIDVHFESDIYRWSDFQEIHLPQIRAGLPPFREKATSCC